MNRHNVLQYGLWANCSNSCKFCLLRNKDFMSKEQMMHRLDTVRQNLDHIDWLDKFQDGVSLLGGELYHITDTDVQNSFMQLIERIIEKVLLSSPNPNVRYSTVTNGIYEPSFLIRVLDRIVEAVGVNALDVNFSYDLKYRFPSSKAEMQCLSNINLVHNRYDYKVGVQMIATQYLIDAVLSDEFNIQAFTDKYIPGNQLVFLYPHPLNPELAPLHDFQFKRESLLMFADLLADQYPKHWLNFYHSTKNSATYKYTGMRWPYGPVDQQPELTDGKEEITDCGHSVLYRCYSDSDKCMLCDLEHMYED